MDASASADQRQIHEMERNLLKHADAVEAAKREFAELQGGAQDAAPTAPERSAPLVSEAW